MNKSVWVIEAVQDKSHIFLLINDSGLIGFLPVYPTRELALEAAKGHENLVGEYVFSNEESK